MEKRHVLISTVLEAQNALVFISGSDNCNVLIEAKSDAVPELNLAEASIELGIKSSSKVAYQILTAKCQLGYSLSRVYNPLFAGLDFIEAIMDMEVFTGLDNDKAVDGKGLVFGNIIPGTYDVDIS